jgi:hypothetical protein
MRKLNEIPIDNKIHIDSITFNCQPRSVNIENVVAFCITTVKIKNNVIKRFFVIKSIIITITAVQIKIDSIVLCNNDC